VRRGEVREESRQPRPREEIIIIEKTGIHAIHELLYAIILLIYIHYYYIHTVTC